MNLSSFPIPKTIRRWGRRNPPCRWVVSHLYCIELQGGLRILPDGDGFKAEVAFCGEKRTRDGFRTERAAALWASRTWQGIYDAEFSKEEATL